MHEEQKFLFIAPIQHDATHGGAWVKVPFDAKEVFGSGRPKVKAVFDGKVIYRGSLMRMGGPDYLLGVRKDVRKALHKSPGDEVEVVLSLDTEARIVEIPDILLTAFREHPEVEAYFRNMAYTHQREYVEYILSGKKEETRE
ncbi:MAG TPA: hypothetical protein DIU20_01885, partial [Cryomorphaceae bacterium]|nr:hypothetical protein [Cryomorphaceae bacterium]